MSFARFTTLLLALCLSLSTMGCGGAQGPTKLKIQHDYDKVADFTKYKTFNFTQSPAPPKSTFAAARIKQKIGENLMARGYTYQADQSPDLVVRWYTVVQNKKNEKVGTLVIEILDREVLDVIWKGWATDGLTDATDVKALIDSVVHDTLARFSSAGAAAPSSAVAGTEFVGPDYVLANATPTATELVTDKQGFAKPGADDVDKGAPKLNYVWEDGYELDGKELPGFYRVKERAGYTWVKGTYKEKVWSAPHWQAAKANGGLVWVNGFRGSDGYWVAGHWREKQRKGMVWLPQGKDDKGNIIAGYWKPTAQKTGMVWSRGHRTPTQSWSPGYWRPATKDSFTWVDGGFGYGQWIAASWYPIQKKKDHLWSGGYYNGTVWVNGYYRPVVRTGYYWGNPYWYGGAYTYGAWYPVGTGPILVVRPMVVYHPAVIVAYRAPYVGVYVGFGHVGYHHSHYHHSAGHYNAGARARVNYHHNNYHRNNPNYRRHNPNARRPGGPNAGRRPGGANAGRRPGGANAGRRPGGANTGNRSVGPNAGKRPGGANARNRPSGARPSGSRQHSGTRRGPTPRSGRSWGGGSRGGRGGGGRRR